MRKARLETEREEQTIPFDIWDRTGVTTHMGGIYATQLLIEMCHLATGQTVLVIGCGTGHTACLLAQKHQARVVALDINPRNLQEAQEQIARTGVGDRVWLMQADAHELACLDRVFDAVIAESVLVFCDAERVAAEVSRVLKPKGVMGVNELTFLKPPPEQLLVLLQDTLGLQAFREDEWRSILIGAGLVNVSSVVRKIKLGEQLVSRIKVDGLRNYLSSVVSGLSEPGIRDAFISRDMLRAARRFVPYVGYGLYVGRKSTLASRE